MNDYDVLVLGEILWDHVGTSKKSAGAPLNFARHLKRQGMMPYLVSAVGLDEAGEELVRVIERERIPNTIPVVGAATGRADVVQLPEGKNSFALKTPAAWSRMNCFSSCEYRYIWVLLHPGSLAGFRWQEYPAWTGSP